MRQRVAWPVKVTVALRASTPQRALNLELAVIRDATRANVATAGLRFAFWREVVESACGDGRHPHPLTAQLAAAVTKHNHTKRFLDRIIDARVRIRTPHTPDAITTAL